MTQLGLDYETYSDTNLITHGTDLYSKCDSTEVLMLGWAFDDDEPELWYPHREPMPRDVRQALTMKGVEKRAWNATFELLISRHVLGIDVNPDQWIDPMIMAHYCSLPGSLEKAGKIIRLPEEMLKMAAEGKRLIKMFSVPQKPTKKQPLTRLGWWTDPEEFSKFGEYCKQDVITERAIYRRLSKYNLPNYEWDNWRLDFKINQRGYPIDAEFAQASHNAFVYIRREITEQLNEITGLANSKATAQMSRWAKERGYNRENMQKDTVKKAIRDDDLDPTVVEVLKDYQKASSTNPSKYAAILRIIGEDSRARNSMQFMGAQRTHREAGRVVQFQNISRPSKPFENFEYAAQARRDVIKYPPAMLKMLYDDPMDTVVSLIRSTIKAPKGRQLAVADLASIENVMIGHLARCEKTLQEFRDGKDPYLAFGVYLFDMDYEDLLAEVQAGDKSKRTLAKPGKLGAGYRLGGGDLKANGDKTGLWAYAENLGVEMTQEEAQRSINVYREQYPAVVQLWYDIEKACKKVITGRAASVRVNDMTIDAKGPFLRIGMPSGSHLHYLRPKIEEKRTPWGSMRPTITYEGIDQYTKKWVRVSTHGGKLTENVTQKAARDVLFHGLQNADEADLMTVGHVHDEIIAEVDYGDEKALTTLIGCMTDPPEWAPDLPLNASGYLSDFYTKD